VLETRAQQPGESARRPDHQSQRVIVLRHAALFQLLDHAPGIVVAEGAEVDRAVVEQLEKRLHGGHARPDQVRQAVAREGHEHDAVLEPVADAAQGHEKVVGHGAQETLELVQNIGDADRAALLRVAGQRRVQQALQVAQRQVGVQPVLEIGDVRVRVLETLLQARDALDEDRIVALAGGRVVGRVQLGRDRGAVDEQLEARPRLGGDVVLALGKSGQQRVRVDADRHDRALGGAERRVPLPRAVGIAGGQPFLVQKLEQVGLAHAGRADHGHRLAPVQRLHDAGHFRLAIVGVVVARVRHGWSSPYHLNVGPSVDQLVSIDQLPVCQPAVHSCKISGTPLRSQFNTTGVIETPIFMHIEGKPYGNTEEGNSARLVPPDGIDPSF